MTINEVAEKYGLAPLETFKEEFTEIEFYESLLKQTDHIPNKILEGVATSADYANELYYREVARQELDKLNGGTGGVVNAVPLDALLNTMLGVE